MADLATKEITSVDQAATGNANALLYIDNNGVFQRGSFDGVFAISKSFEILRGDGQAHNGLFRGKNLSSVYTVDQIYAMVHSGKFDDLFLGDYFTVSITTTLPDETVKTENITLMIAAFDYYYNMGDTALTTHHVVLIPRKSGFATSAKMNNTNITTGGYIGSFMHTDVLPCYAASLKTALNNHVLSHRSFLTSTVNASTPSMAGAGLSGASTAYEWVSVDLQLMNEVQLYGSMVWSSSAYEVGTDNRKLPVFNYITPVQYDRLSFWLRSVVSSTRFAVCNAVGYTNCNDASVNSYVRPIILFG